tara:strand:- start:1285 stop:1470 length:186 start_codon:yes stop_codon:yes gene_type:complete
MKTYIAELKSSPSGRYAVSPDHGGGGYFTTSTALAFAWSDIDQLRKWMRGNGDKWMTVEKP